MSRVNNLEAHARIGALITWISAVDAMRPIGSIRKTLCARLRAIPDAFSDDNAAWRPIESAPREYPILVCGPYSEYASIVQWNWPAHEWRCQADDGDVIARQDAAGTSFKTFPAPTHWRFLPHPRREDD